MRLELDHLFVFSTRGLPEAKLLLDAGFVLSESVTHVGQGTRSRFIFLERVALEFIWVHSIHEARANALRLDRRADLVGRGLASPVGLAMRGNDGEPPAGFRKYEQSYNRLLKIHVDPESVEDPTRPFVFHVSYSDGRPNEAMQPRNKDRLARLIAHRNGSRNVLEASIESPRVDRARVFASDPCLQIVESDRQFVTLRLDGEFEPVQLASYCRIEGWV